MKKNYKIQLKNLTLRYSNDLVIDSVNWDIEVGSYNVLVGSNGSGKSTLIKALLNLIEPNEGSIKYFSNSSEITNSEHIAKNFGYIPQFSSIKKTFPITVREIIELECTAYEANCDLACSIGNLKLFHIDDLLDKNINDLSGGELQKVLIVRGLVTSPSVLILDEPTNNLDRDSKKQVLEFLKELSVEKNKTIIHITHDEHEVEEIDNFNLVRIIDKKLIFEN